MIWVTRLRGQALVINADLIECVEHTPDTVITMIDGRKYMVEETPDEIVARTVQYRAAVLHSVVPDRAARPEVTTSAGEASIHHLDEKRRND
jgi:flagellar protein FlbD